MGIQNVKVQKLIVCDRCGKNFAEAAKTVAKLADAQESLNANTTPILEVTSPLGKPIKYMDLCPRCKVVVTKLIKGLDKVVLAKRPVRR